MSRGYKYDVWDAENFDDIRMDAKDFIPPKLLVGFS